MITRFSPAQLLTALAVGAFTSIALSLLIGAHPFAEAAIDWGGAARACGLLPGDAETRGAVATSLVLLIAGLHILPAVRTWRRSESATREAALLLDARRIPLEDRLHGLVREFDLAGSLALIESDERFAFTLGVRRPTIYISRAATQQLDDGELKAVLLHEKHHVQHGDALAVRRLRALRAMLGYLPGVRWLTEAFLRSREYAADDSVVAATGGHLALLRAFLKLQPTASPDRYAVGYMDFAVGRVNRLKGVADRDDVQSEISGARALLVSFAVLVLLPVVTLFLTEPHLSSLLPFH
jgi:Zn-dependent protease with chaperone function